MLSYEDYVVAPLWSVGFTFLLFYFGGGALYRLWLSPIAKFPGPKLAALTFWYEFYYDVVKGGQYTWEIRRMHEKYGPIVRINPFELHINDPEYYDVLYSGGSTRRDKWAWSAKMFGNSTSVFSTVPHDHHRLRRAVLNPYFSKRSIMRLEHTIQSVVESLCARFAELRSSQQPVNLGDAYAALTMDVITEYSFAKSYGCVAEPDFAPEWPVAVESISIASHLNKQFGWLFPLMNLMPAWMVAKLNPHMRRLIHFREDLSVRVQAVTDGKNEPHGSDTHPTLFHEMLKSDLPAAEKSLPRLVDEGQTIIAAGQVTTAHYLKTTSYHLLANPDILRKLKAELASAMPDAASPAPLQKLEQLPYLSAVVLEGFRISYGVTSRLQRVSPDAPLAFDGWTIPAGTPVGMTSIFMHDNPEHFPEPCAFQPERWLVGGAESRLRLEKYLVNFSKGSRACLGINLARAEIYLTRAAVFRRFDMRLYYTERADVDVAHDYFNPSPRKESKGVRVVVVE